MVTITLKGRFCESEKLVRDGFTRHQKQRLRCRDSQRVSREKPAAPGYREAEKERILNAYEARSSLRGLERTFGVARKTVSVWLKKKDQQAPRPDHYAGDARPRRRASHRVGVG